MFLYKSVDSDDLIILSTEGDEWDPKNTTEDVFTCSDDDNSLDSIMKDQKIMITT